MMKVAASLTVTGLLGLLILEALKILLAPVSALLLGFVVLVLKIALAVFGLGLAIVVLTLSIWAYRRFRGSERTAGVD